MELSVTVRRLLEQCPGEALCDACLAFACAVSLTEMRAVTGTLTHEPGFGHSTTTCVSCRRQTPTLVWRGPDASSTCAHCRRRIEPLDDTMLIETDVFHGHCWRRLTTDVTVRRSRALGRRSWELIRQSRDQMGLETGESAEA
jgi:hypothetical protein